MKNLYIILFIPVFLLSNSYWTSINEGEFNQNNGLIKTLNEKYLLDLIKEAPLISSNRKSIINLEFPTPDNDMIQFEIYESPVMPINLSKKYPNIKTYTGKGINNPNDRISITVGNSGFKILILSNSKRIFIQTL